MIDLSPFIVVAKVVVLVLGGVITHLAYRAFRRTGANALKLFAIGFGVITVGALIGGGIDQLAGFGLEVGVFVQSTLTAIGFVVLAWSLYARADTTVTSA
jgi:hypothetical protein